jgi:WD40 repeat protein
MIQSVAFSPDGRTVVTGSFDKTGRLWEVPAVLEGSGEEVVLWTQVLTGMELDAADVVRGLDSATWQRCRRTLAERRLDRGLRQGPATPALPGSEAPR